MNLEARKVVFVQEFLQIENEEIILALGKFRTKRKA
jgi:hypothetical protein